MNEPPQEDEKPTEKANLEITPDRVTISAESHDAPTLDRRLARLVAVALIVLGVVSFTALTISGHIVPASVALGTCLIAATCTLWLRRR